MRRWTKINTEKADWLTPIKANKISPKTRKVDIEEVNGLTPRRWTKLTSRR